MIDLRSDTCTKPTEAMRRAMADADVGDDVLGDDPTVRALEERTAELLGKEDAVYVTSGTLANQIALRTHALGDEILCEASAHVHLYEGGGAAALSGVSLRTIDGRRGLFGPQDVDPMIRAIKGKMHTWMIPPARLLCVENTHNVGGGTVWPLEQLNAVAERARHHGLSVHMDGARLWNAAAKTGISVADYAGSMDTVSVCFSKGLGAPVGSCLAGPADFVLRCRRGKQLYGGGFRQAGIIAAGALHALNHHRERLVDDHRNAGIFAEAVAELKGVDLDPTGVETNLVYFDVAEGTAPALCAACEERGLRILPMGPRKIRAVFHLDISATDAAAAAGIVAEGLKDVRA